MLEEYCNRVCEARESVYVRRWCDLSSHTNNLLLISNSDNIDETIRVAGEVYKRRSGAGAKIGYDLRISSIYEALANDPDFTINRKRAHHLFASFDLLHSPFYQIIYEETARIAYDLNPNLVLDRIKEGKRLLSENQLSSNDALALIRIAQSELPMDVLCKRLRAVRAQFSSLYTPGIFYNSSTLFAELTLTRQNHGEEIQVVEDDFDPFNFFQISEKSSEPLEEYGKGDYSFEEINNPPPSFSPKNLRERVFAYHDQLKSTGRREGSALLTTSALMVAKNGDTQENKDKFSDIFKHLKGLRCNLDRGSYVQAGLLALAPHPVEKIISDFNKVRSLLERNRYPTRNEILLTHEILRKLYFEEDFVMAGTWVEKNQLTDYAHPRMTRFVRCAA